MDKALAYLTKVEMLQGLDEEALGQLLAGAREVPVEAGAWLMREGEQGDDMYLILEGLFEVSVRQGSVEEMVAERRPGEVVGELALLGRTTRTASVRATAPSLVLQVSRGAFEELLARPGAATAIYRTSLERERDLASLLSRREKLAALGTMAAGLAHELNNPATALRRSAKELARANSLRDRRTSVLFGRGLSEEEMAHALDLGELAARNFGAGTAEDPTGAAADALEEYLTELGVPEAWEAAGAFADAGWSAAGVRDAVAPFQGPMRADVARWLAADAACRSLLHEIDVSSQAVASLVGAVKEYSHMDRAPQAEVDVHESIENTLVVLRHRLKEGGVEVVRDYGAAVPTVQAYASELSQVWTNLIDNAVAAMKGGGRLIVRTRCDADQVVVEMTDDGSGITEAAQCHLFEPFFTTKGVGEGTGLGLYLSKEIVAKRHGGSIGCDSRPGATTFKVTLPRKPRWAEAPAGAGPDRA